MPANLTLSDARAIVALASPGSAFMTTHTWAPAAIASSDRLRMETLRPATSSFFSTLQVPFRYGGSWTAEDDTKRTRALVLSDAANRRLFGGHDSRGQLMRVSTELFTVVGVLAPWNPAPKFYDLGAGPFSDTEELFVPFDTWIELPQDYGLGSQQCWGAGTGENRDPTSDVCAWVSVWAKVSSEARTALSGKLQSYADEQHAAGRLLGKGRTGLISERDWVHQRHVVPDAVRVQFWVAMGLFLVCLINSTSLQLVRYRSRLREIGLRRALGASRREILTQILVDASVMGAIGGIIGVVLGYAGLLLLRLNPAHFALTFSIAPAFALCVFLAAIFSTVIASVYPSISVVARAPVAQLRAT